MATVADLITSALRELGIVAVTDTPGSELSALALSQLNRILDRWNADRRTVYADVHTAPVALTAGTNPHTIGLAANTPDLTVTTNRPVSIEGARLTTDNGETYLAPMTKRDAAWWHALPSPGTASAYPTDFYYNPSMPVGALYLWPEPSDATVKIQLWYRVVLSQVATSDTLSLPPGYFDALHATLKERLAALPMFASMSNPGIQEEARAARAAAFGNNEPIGAMATADIGIGGGGARDYRVELGPFSLMGH